MIDLETITTSNTNTLFFVSNNFLLIILLNMKRTRELATTDDEYVRWTQWIFLQLFKVGLARQSEVYVNWCPALGSSIFLLYLLLITCCIVSHPFLLTRCF